jgi:hypothetical protein
MINLTDLKIKNKKTKEIINFYGLNNLKLKDKFLEYNLDYKYSDYTYTEYNYSKEVLR